jgi:hypothetical protein
MGQSADIRLLTPTLEAVEDVAALLQTEDGEDVRPSDLLEGEVTPALPAEQRLPFLRLVVEAGQVPRAIVHQATVRIAQQWLGEVVRCSARAGERVLVYAERVGVAPLLKQQSSSTSMARAVAQFDADAYQVLWCEMGLEQALFYMGIKSVNHIDENIEDYML